MTDYDKIAFGDYQTPIYFTEILCDYLKEIIEYPTKILEPTCGVGNFLISCSNKFLKSKLYGIDINNDYLKIAKSMVNNAIFFNENVFDFDFSNIKSNKDDSYLIVGNPPWVTNSKLSMMESNNVPSKSNFKENTGLSALMGDPFGV